jgi:hypothetical protein
MEVTVGVGGVLLPMPPPLELEEPLPPPQPRTNKDTPRHERPKNPEEGIMEPEYIPEDRASSVMKNRH